MAKAGNPRPVVVWFRNDLRVHDNEVLLQAAKASHNHVVPVYCFDIRQYSLVITHRSRRCGQFPKCGRPRARFLIESVDDLRTRLQELGSGLVVRTGLPEEEVARVAAQVGATQVFAHQEVCSEEVAAEHRLKRQLEVPLSLHWGAVTLCHLDDLDFGPRCKHLPSVFTQFRKRVEADMHVRPVVAAPARLAPLPSDLELGSIPTVEDLCPGQHEPDERAVLPFKGGETAARARLQYYLWESNLLASYKDTRNGLVGGDYSSKFSPWLAHGNLTARWIYHEVKRYEQERTENTSTYWLIFELLWRDYFRFVALQHGTAIFKPGGVQHKDVPWRHSPADFEAWQNGQTGFPFIDANMRELAKTGFMSNRGRQNVASFLTKDLQIDWRLGAEWFETLLLDHDPCSNYGNWNYAAGVGNDPRQGRHFNVIKQAKTYDPTAEYVHLWVPELRGLDAPQAHVPFKLSSEELAQANIQLGSTYPRPVVDRLDGGRLPLKVRDETAYGPHVQLPQQGLIKMILFDTLFTGLSW
ncbi:uncharacterized protein MONBRDRAFT_16910 [Monosiga brevicollis MX1]|uniref:Cryptochrome DASH n=1 Tax=Monosiga brevicollis TaxID=81824 RepID=A9UXR7_MONBE|nr:uncharacterized protein MONBRDRAFT_16910 [Monosiga brevicollis MX1]EDQ89735.1 predicted protein [Monosiga brevicollis MX1]|eukprot:XP_001745157.1 hypothetical protein [Monosiga brevicollis MX1]